MRPLEMVIPVDVETFDPRFAADFVSLRASRLVHAGLVRLDPDSLLPAPYLATGWEWQGPHLLRVELREGIRFHSGAPFTSHDVAASLGAYGSPAVGSRHARAVEAIAQVDEVGPHTVLIHLLRDHATLITDLEVPVLRADQAFGPADPSGVLDGLGPFRVARATRGDVLLEPAATGLFPPPLHPVVLRTVHDDNARALRLLAGRSDVATNVLGTLPALLQNPELATFARAGANLTYLVPRVDRGILQDLRVRRALSLGVDRSALVRTLFQGYARVATGLFPVQFVQTSEPSSGIEADLRAPFAFDPATARAALASTGLRSCPLTLLTSTDRFRVTVARVIGQQLAAVGFAVNVVPLELGTLLSRLNAGDFELASLGLPELTEPDIVRSLLHGAATPPVGVNRGRVADAALDRLLERGERTLDRAARRAIYAEVEERVRDQALLLPLWTEDQVVVVSRRASTFVPSAEGRWLSLASLP